MTIWSLFFPAYVPLIKISEDPDNANTDMENSNQIGKDPINSQIEKSRRFSKLPPAPKDSPNAVKLGSKFTKIEILNEPSNPIQSKFPFEFLQKLFLKICMSRIESRQNFSVIFDSALIFSHFLALLKNYF